MWSVTGVSSRNAGTPQCFEALLTRVLHVGVAHFLDTPSALAVCEASKGLLSAMAATFDGVLPVHMLHLCRVERRVTLPYSWMPVVAEGLTSGASGGPCIPSTAGYCFPDHRLTVVPVLDQEFAVPMREATPQAFLQAIPRGGANMRSVWCSAETVRSRAGRLFQRWTGHVGFQGVLQLWNLFSARGSGDTLLPPGLAEAVVSCIPLAWRASLYGLELRGKASPALLRALGSWLEAPGPPVALKSLTLPAIGACSPLHGPQLQVDPTPENRQFIALGKDYNVYREGGSGRAVPSDWASPEARDVGDSTWRVLSATAPSLRSLRCSHAWDLGHTFATRALLGSRLLAPLGPDCSSPAPPSLASLQLSSGALRCLPSTTLLLPDVLASLAHRGNLVALDLGWPSRSVSRSPAAAMAIGNALSELLGLRTLLLSSWRFDSFEQPQGPMDVQAAFAAGEGEDAADFEALAAAAPVSLMDGLRTVAPSLRKLSIGGAPHSPDVLGGVFSALRGADFLHTLDLFSTGLTPAATEHLSSLLPALPNLRWLSLGGNPNLGDEGMQNIVNCLPSLHSLRCLVLTRTGLSPTSAALLADTLRSTPFPLLPLTSLQVGQNPEAGDAAGEAALTMFVRALHFRWALRGGHLPPLPAWQRTRVDLRQWAAEAFESVEGYSVAGQGVPVPSAAGGWPACEDAAMARLLRSLGVDQTPSAGATSQQAASLPPSSGSWRQVRIEASGQATVAAATVLRGMPPLPPLCLDFAGGAWECPPPPSGSFLLQGISLSETYMKRCAAVLSMAVAGKCAEPLAPGDPLHPSAWDPAWDGLCVTTGQLDTCIQFEGIHAGHLHPLLGVLPSTRASCARLLMCSLSACNLVAEDALLIGRSIEGAPGTWSALNLLDLSKNPDLGDRGAVAVLSSLNRFAKPRSLWGLRLHGCGLTVAAAAHLATALLTCSPSCMSWGRLGCVDEDALFSDIAISVLATSRAEPGAASAPGQANVEAGAEDCMMLLGQPATKVFHQASHVVTAASYPDLVQRRLEDLAAVAGVLIMPTSHG